MNEIKMKPKASPLHVSCKLISVLQFLFLFPLELLCAKLLDDPEVELVGGAELSAGNRAFQEVLAYQGADDQGGVAVRASHCACGDVGFEGGKVRADMAAGADGVFSSSACGPGSHLLKAASRRIIFKSG